MNKYTFFSGQIRFLSSNICMNSKLIKLLFQNSTIKKMDLHDVAESLQNVDFFSQVYRVVQETNNIIYEWQRVNLTTRVHIITSWSNWITNYTNKGESFRLPDGSREWRNMRMYFLSQVYVFLYIRTYRDYRSKKSFKYVYCTIYLSHRKRSLKAYWMILYSLVYPFRTMFRVTKHLLNKYSNTLLMITIRIIKN